MTRTHHRHGPVALEVCIHTLEDARCCAASGVARVELNSAIELGGLTPPIGLTELVVAALKTSGCKVIAMVRPRPGGFAYADSEIGVMAREIERLLAAGVDGVAFGVLQAGGAIAEPQNRALLEPVLAADRQAVFHRAFDLTPDKPAAIETLIALGFHRVLTSGGMASAAEGAGVIRACIERAAGRIEVLPGGGIKPSNAAALVQATGCNQVHASLRTSVTDPTSMLNPAVRFNAPGMEEDAYSRVDAEKLHAMMQVLRVHV